MGVGRGWARGRAWHRQLITTSLSALAWSAKPVAASTRLLVLCFLAGLCVVSGVLLVLPPIVFLPPLDSTRDVLRGFLAAESTLVALSLTVLIFLLQSIRARSDLDEATFQLFLKRGLIRPVFVASVLMLLATGWSFLLVQPSGIAVPVARGAGNLGIIGVLSFGFELALVLFLFHRMLDLMGPSVWAALRFEAATARVVDAVADYVRQQQALSAAGGWSVDTVLRGQAHGGSADEAVRLVCEDALRALGDRRYSQYKDALDTLRAMIELAAERVESAGFSFADAGRALSWPPLPEIQRHFEAVRREVAQRAADEFTSGLNSFDYWLLAKGGDLLAGEILELGLDGLRRNYMLTYTASNMELLPLTVDLAHQHLLAPLVRIETPLISGTAEQRARARSFLIRIMRQVGLYLDAALSFERPQDFHAFVAGSRTLERLAVVSLSAEDSMNLAAEFARLRRVTLLGLGGRILSLAESGRVTQPDAYLTGVREIYSSVTALAEDTAFAMQEEQEETLGWDRWEMEGKPELEMYFVQAERYPLSFFTVRALELIGSEPVVLHLSGQARRVSEWVRANVERLETWVEAAPGAVSLDERRKALLESLDEAIRRDERDSEDDIISRPVDRTKVNAFRTDVYADRRHCATLECVFSSGGMYRLVDGPEPLFPPWLGGRLLLPKAPFTDRPDWVMLSAWSIGLSFEEGLADALSTALQSSPEIRVDGVRWSAAALLHAVDIAAEGIGGEGLLLLLVGSWPTEVSDLGQHASVTPEWSLPQESRRTFIMGVYRNGPIVHVPGSAAPVAFAVHVPRWGCMLRAQIAGEELQVDVLAITPARAAEMLKANPSATANADVTDEKLRRLLLSVESVLGERVGFRILDAGAARRLVLRSAPTSSRAPDRRAGRARKQRKE